MEIPHEILHALELKHTFDPKSTYTLKRVQPKIIWITKIPRRVYPYMLLKSIIPMNGNGG